MILLDNEIAFRFEHDLEDEDTNLVRERSVLRAIKGRLDAMPVPDYTFVPKSPDFAGYGLIPGTRLSPWRFRRLSKSSRAEAANRLGDFLSKLHSIPVAEVRDLGVNEDERKFTNHRSWAESQFSQHADTLAPDECALCQRWLLDLHNKHHLPILAFTHNDLWHKHIYHNPQTGHLTGIIDWGDIRIADPAWDFFGLWAYGEPFVDSVISHYRHVDPSLKHRSWDCYRVKVVFCLTAETDQYRNFARQFLNGLAENKEGEFR